MIGVGQQLGGYTLLARIGHGWLGEVYLAQHRRVDRLAAIKVVLPELSQKANVVDQFFKEARNTISIKHPGIIEILDCDLVDDRAFVIMEFLDGESLGAYFARVGKLEQDLAFLLGVTAAAAGAIGAAHLAGIVHRALKPGNIYLHLRTPMDPSVTVKVLDFGIAQLSREDGGPSTTGSGVVLGAPTYMSPEQCRGAGRFDARSDIYSLGCVLYEGLCGRPPFGGLGMGELLVAHISQPPTPPIELVRGLSPKLNGLVMRMLAKKPEERPQTMADVINRLRDCARALGIDFEGQLQPLIPVERPMDLISLAAAAAPSGPVAVKRSTPTGSGQEAARPSEPPRELRPARVDEPAAPPPAPASPLPLSPRAVPAADPRPAPPLWARAGETLLLDEPASAEAVAVLRRPALVPSVQAAAGGTMILDTWEPPHQNDDDLEDSDESSDADWGQTATDARSTTLSTSAGWLERLAFATTHRNGRLAIAGAVLLVMVAIATVLLSTRDPTTSVGADSAAESRAVPPSDPAPAGETAPVRELMAPPTEARPARPATVQVDIHGVDPQTTVTVDGQPAALPIRLPRGPQTHQIVLQTHTGRQRHIEVDGTRDRVIEVVVARAATGPAAPAGAPRGTRPDVGPPRSVPPVEGVVGAPKKPTRTKDFKALTDL